jgi:tRNA threonylcarbamoyladenosine biosynthesis protein TsaE
MGVGKTTFIKAICEALGVTGVINSPSFSIVNEYCTPAGAPVYHFDFYRIKDLAEACDTGCEDYFYSGAYCFVEWPEKAAELLPPDTATVQIAENDGKRIVTVVNPQRKR